jgi:hypothetical protein
VQADEIPVQNRFVMESNVKGTTMAPRGSLVTLEGTIANTATVQFWVMDDSGYVDSNKSVPKDFMGTEWYSLGTPVVVTVGACAAGPALPAGYVYAQITAGPALDATVKVGPAP